MEPKDKTNKREKALVVFSGGQDSTTCLYWALNNFSEVHTITFGYGQNHSAEVECARKIAMREGVPFHYMDVSFIGTLSSNALTDKTITMDSESPEEGFPNTFVPGRNLFFISIAAVYAREHGIGNIITGVSQTDFSGYPDCRDSFIKSLNVTINLAMDEELDIITPLMWKDKAQTWKMADELGVMEIIRNETLTCYNGIIGDGCGDCPSCKLRKRGLELYLEEKNRI